MRIAECHNDRKHYCKGLCYACYRREWKRSPAGKACAKRSMDRWKKKAISEGRRVKPTGIRIPPRVWVQDKCQICNKPEPLKKFFVDHDHSRFPPVARGILCPSCNTAVGFMESLIRKDLLEIALDYVITHGFENQVAA